MGSSGNENDKPQVTIEQVRIEERVEVIVQRGTADAPSPNSGAIDGAPLLGSDGEHRLQEKYGRTTHALAFYKHQVIDHLNSAMQAFLARQEMMFLGTADSKGHADSAFRCGHAGFVKVLDERTLAFPEYRGNGVMASLGNITENPHVGLLFIDFGDQIGLHISGSAQIVENNDFLEFLKDHPAEQAILGDAVLKDIIESDGGHLERWVMVEVAEAYVQCSKHIPPMQRLDHDIKWGEEHPYGQNIRGVAIASTGVVWVTNEMGNTITALHNNGTLIGNFHSTAANFNAPEGIAIDSSGDLWVTNSGGDTVTELSIAGFIFHNFARTGSFNGASGVTIDSSSHVWVTNFIGDNVTALNNDGTLFGNFAPPGSNFDGPIAVAIDSSGNLWVPNFEGFVTELVGVAAPVLTPMVACLTQTTPATVCLP